MTKRNPKQEGSNVFDCKPQAGLCPIGCNQCFYNRPGAFYVDPEQPHMPTVEEVGGGILRVNSGHDSNIGRLDVIAATDAFPRRFFNTSIPKLDFPGPVVLTANPEEENRPLMPDDVGGSLDNLMFVRLRVSPTNQQHIVRAVLNWAVFARVPVVLTFMAYYEDSALPKGHEDKYEWKVRHVNSYWCPKPAWMAEVLRDMKRVGGRLVTMCGSPTSGYCRDCRNCETYYWQTIKHLAEVGK